MLEGLDKIDWVKLRHAYGSAVDAPEQIRNLLSNKPEDVEEAFEYLYQAICHQGTIYEATSYVIPFLMEILDSTAYENIHGELLRYLSTLHYGGGYESTHLSITPDSDMLRVHGSLEKYRETIFEELAVAARVFPALAEGLPIYERFSRHKDESIRKTIVSLFVSCIALDHSVFEKVFAWLEDEPSRQVRASIIFNLGLCGVTSKRFMNYILEGFDNQHESLIQAACAISLVYISSSASKKEHIQRISDFLLNMLKNSESEIPDGMRSAALQAFSKLHPRVATSFLLPVLQSKDWISSSVVYSLLDLSFPRKTDWNCEITYRSLSMHQREVLNAIVKADSFWNPNTIHTFGRPFGLPSDREKLKDFLAQHSPNGSHTA